MKLFIASDIHGSAYWCEKMLSAYREEKADRLLLLGDILYHGPRNDLPKDYAPKKVIELLSAYKDEILCVRGNCDTEVDQMVLPFPILADYAVLSVDGVDIYATHGHKFGADNPPPLKKGDILLCGHTHVAADEEKDGFRYINPGSVSIPKEDTGNGYIVFENGSFKRHLL
jgi:putative phosphoesterase